MHKIIKLLLAIIILTVSLPLIAQRVQKTPLQKRGFACENNYITWRNTSGTIVWDTSNNEIIIQINDRNTNKEIKFIDVVFNTQYLETKYNKKGKSVTLDRKYKGNAIDENNKKVDILFNHRYPINKQGIVSYNVIMMEVIIIYDNKKTGYTG